MYDPAPLNQLLPVISQSLHQPALLTIHPYLLEPVPVLFVALAAHPIPPQLPLLDPQPLPRSLYPLRPRHYHAVLPQSPLMHHQHSEALHLQQASPLSPYE